MLLARLTTLILELRMFAGWASASLVRVETSRCRSYVLWPVMLCRIRLCAYLLCWSTFICICMPAMLLSPICFELSSRLSQSVYGGRFELKFFQLFASTLLFLSVRKSFFNDHILWSSGKNVFAICFVAFRTIFRGKFPWEKSLALLQSICYHKPFIFSVICVADVFALLHRALNYLASLFLKFPDMQLTIDQTVNAF